MDIKQYAEDEPGQLAFLKMLDSFLLPSQWDVNLTATILRWGGNCFEGK